MATRRQILSASGLIGLAGLTAIGAQKPKSNDFLLGGYNRGNTSYGVACLNSKLDLIWQLECDSRVHDIAVNDLLDLGAVSARRPGRFIQLFSLSDGTKLDRLSAPADYQFEGHLCFHQQELWVTASKKKTSEGLLIRYSLENLADPAELIALPGLGPHQILIAGDSLAWVAIGGWHTENRDILNSEGFNSRLALVNLNTKEIRTWDSPNPDLSVRHLAIYEGNLTVAMQYANPKPTSIPLVYQFSPINLWRPLTEPTGGWRIFRGYIGSVAQTNNWIAATSPQGHQAALWGKQGKEFIGTRSLMDAGGAASIDDQPWISSGSGQILTKSLEEKVGTQVHWDNHWTSYSKKINLT